MKFTRHTTLSALLLSLLIGIFTDTLLRQTIFGINFLLWSLMWLIVLLVVALKKKRFGVRFAVFTVLGLVNSLLVYVRSEAVIQFWSVCIVLVCLAWLASALHIQNYQRLPLLKRFAEGVAGLVLSSVSIIGSVYSNLTARAPKVRISKGVLLSAVLVAIFIALFSSSDAIFRSQFEWLGDGLFDLGALFEDINLARLIGIAFLSMLSLFGVAFAITRRKGEADESEFSLRRVLSQRDGVVVLASLVVLFSFFSLVQLRYLFGGTNLPDGLTYAEYARRGYGELLVATLLASSVVHAVIASIKDSRSKRITYLSTALMALNVFVVISAWQRLSLYESAYGWTMTRFVARLGLIVLALGCMAMFMWIWKFISSKRLFASGWYIVAVVLTCASILNPVGIITAKNLTERNKREVALDTEYIHLQSRDSWPALCKYAGEIEKSFPEEFRRLTTKPMLENELYYPKDYYDTPFAPTRDSSKGFSAHFTRNLSYVNKYQNCLP
jgi:hypothetical protein